MLTFRRHLTRLIKSFLPRDGWPILLKHETVDVMNKSTIYYPLTAFSCFFRPECQLTVILAVTSTPSDHPLHLHCIRHLDKAGNIRAIDVIDTAILSSTVVDARLMDRFHDTSKTHIDFLMPP